MENISPTHPFIGTWVTEDEDSDVAFSISVQDGKFQVAGFCISDGEFFEITELTWDGECLSFMARMPSTDFKSKNIFRLRPDGRADLALTIYEVWKKEKVKPGDIPKGWNRT